MHFPAAGTMSRESQGPRIVGVTGGLGSGKTTVCNFLRQGRAPVISADEISHCLMRPGHPIYDRTIEAFGEKILNADGQLDRRVLGERVFSDEEARRCLNGITHPAIVKEMRRQVSRATGRGAQVVVLDIPLLYEVGLEAMCDEVWVVWCRPEQQVRRVMQREGLSKDEVNKRLEAQMPLDQKVQRADRVIDNSGSKASLVAHLEALWDQWTAEHGFV